jgi:uncharacterized membrane protein YdcZ (DUF606 family)
MKTDVLAFLGGMVGAVLMDITKAVAARIGITGGGNVALVGRWFMGLSNPSAPFSAWRPAIPALE